MNRLLAISPDRYAPRIGRRPPDTSLGQSYRADIDGLRAIAVIGVLLSHMHLSWARGGYVGVDVFFVISGYVVSGDLMRRAERGVFSAPAFYMRRIRRLMPNLLAMGLAVLVLTTAVFLPSDLIRIPARFAASMLGLSNWLYAYQSGYFAPSSEWNVLLHTWTLGVEFQFYLVVPLLMLALLRWGPAPMRGAVVATGLASLAYALATSARGDSWHFYDTGARIWEFVAGIALHFASRNRPGSAAATAIGLVALAAIAVAFGTLGRDPLFPDARALVPVVATAMLIHVAPSSVPLSAALGSAPMRAIGKASYSIYLWHWPFIVVADYFWPTLARSPIYPLLVGIPALVVAFAAYRWIEEPMRSPTRVSDRAFSAICGAGLAIAGVLCAAILATGAFPQRFDKAIVDLDTEALHYSARRSECHRMVYAGNLQKPCAYGAAVTPTIAIWSDSHGVELADNLAAGLAAQGRAAVLYSLSSCPPRAPRRVETPCDRFDRDVLAALVAAPNIERVVLAGALDSPEYAVDRPAWSREFPAAAERLLAAGKKLTVVYPVPRQPFHVPRAIANELHYGIDYRSARTTRDAYRARLRDVFAVYDALGSRNVSRVYPDRVLCPAKACETDRAGTAFYFDDNHLSVAGARVVAEATLLTFR